MHLLAIDDISAIGRDLHRPECVLGTERGDVYVSDWRGGVTVIRADGQQQSWLSRRSEVDLKPNGFAIAPNGNFIIANLGERGGLWELRLDGGLEPLLTSLDGKPLPPANFVWIDAQARIWASFSTRHLPRHGAWRTDVRDGFVVRIDASGAAVVLDGLHYTNEVRTDPTGRWLYVVETFGQRLVRCALSPEGEIGDRETVERFDPGFFPDGFAFDSEGGIWVTSLISNRIVRLRAGGVEDVLTEPGMERGLAAQAAFEAGRMDAGHLGELTGTRFQHITSVAFGGKDGRTGWLGCLHGSQIFTFRSEVAGAPVPYGRHPLP